MSYHTYFVVTDGQGRLDTFYECEDKYEHMTVEEFKVLYALMSKPARISNRDIAHFHLMDLRARYSMGKFYILKTEDVRLTREDVQRWLEYKKAMKNKELREL